jgi:replicative DNA helicase
LKQQEIDLSVERNILIGLIVSEDFTKQITPALDLSYFKTAFTKIVANWCVDFWQQYSKVPNKNILELFQINSKKIQNDDLIELIQQFLESISSEYSRGEVFNTKYWLEQAEKYFRRQRLENLKETFEKAIECDDCDEAELALAQFKQVKFSETGGFSILRDKEITKRIFSETNIDEELFRLPKILGKVLGGFHRGDLIAVEGPAKRGKSFWLIDLGVVALKHKLRVLFVSLEMNERQMMFRIFQNMTGRTRRDEEFQFPRFTETDVQIEPERRSVISYESVIKKQKQLLKQYGSGEFNLICYPANSVELKKVENYIDRLEVKENMLPDVIVLDYADLLLASYKGEYRHQLDNIWKGLRAIAQKKNCLVITATHTNKATFDRDIKQGDTSEDSRKKNHVSLMFALNQRSQDKEKRLIRVKVTVSRHEQFSDKEVAVLNCFEIGKAILDSRDADELTYHREYQEKKNKKNH